MADLSDERNTQIECVLSVLKESIGFVKMSLLLPKILEKPECLKILAGTEFEPAISLAEDYVRRRGFIVREKRHPLSDNGMLRIFHYFQNNYQMFEMFPNLIAKLTPPDHQLMRAFQKLYEICVHHLQRNAGNELKTERLVAKLYQENEAMKVNIVNLQSKLASQKIKILWKRITKTAYLQKCEEKLYLRKKENEMRMQNEHEKCQRLILANQKSCLEQQNLLEKELKQLDQDYKLQLADWLKNEKKLRTVKNKMELQLASIIRKYDHVISANMIKCLDLQNDLSAKESDMEKLMIIYNNEESIYNQIVVKREEEEELKKHMRIVRFMMDRAARVIQKYWQKWHKHQLKRAKQLKRRESRKKKNKIILNLNKLKNFSK